MNLDNFPDANPRHPLYAAWHQEHVEEPVRQGQYERQKQAARGHLNAARTWRELGNTDLARRARNRAASERLIAFKMGHGL